MSLIETRSPSNDKGVTSQQEHTNSLKVITMQSQTESTLIRLKADKLDNTLLPLDGRAQDKNEDGDVLMLMRQRLNEYHDCCN